MKPLTAEWVSKAEGDYASMQREWRARKNPNYDALCFHAQQCAEKYLKANLQEKSKTVGRTHNLSVLLDSIIQEHPLLEVLRADLLQLNIYSVAFRYPGESATREDAKAARFLCENARKALRQNLGI